MMPTNRPHIDSSNPLTLPADRLLATLRVFLQVVGSAVLIAGLAACRQSYNPPVIQAPNSYLVVDGFINTGRFTATTFNLNRTHNLNDSTTIGIPELRARFSIVGNHGDRY